VPSPHAWPAPAQGGWQEQSIAPSTQALASVRMQFSPSQQPAPPGVHALLCATHATGCVQIPPMQLSIALQQGTVEEQLRFVSAHTLAAWHVPLVAPGAMLQEEPAQQSPFTVQLSPASWQEDGVPEPPVQSAQRPSVQVPLQQASALVQTAPVSLHVLEEVGSRQAKAPLSP
jgi:hypothetical protein